MPVNLLADDVQQPTNLLGDEPKKLDPNILKRIPGAAAQVGSDAWDIMQNIPEATGKFLEGLPADYRALKENAPLAGQQIMNDPGRAARNVAVGLAQYGHELINYPGKMANYMSKIGMIEPETAQIANNAWNQGDIEPQLQQFKGEGKQSGDEALQWAGKNANLIAGGAGLIKSATKLGAKAVAMPFKAAAQTYSDLKESSGLSGAKSAANEAEKAFDEAKSDLSSTSAVEKQAESAASIEAGSANDKTLQRNINKHNQDLADLNVKISNVPGQKPLPEGYTPTSAETFSGANAANAAHEEAKNVLGNIENDISTHLNKGAVHDVRAASRIDEIQNKIKAGISAKYDQLEKNMADKSITITNPGDAKDIMSEINELVKTGDYQSKEGNALLKQLDAVGSQETFSAKDYLTALRSVRDYSRDARQKAYSHGINAEERAQAMARYDELDKKAEEMGKILEDGIGGKDAALLKEANGEWRDKVIPLYKNPIYKSIHYKDQMPDNIMKSLRGSENGNVLIKDIIKSDPELLKNVVGQRYANAPEKLHQAGELESEYIQKMPELQNLMNTHRAAQSTVSNAEKIAKDSALKHKETLMNEKNVSKETARIEKENIANQTEYEKLTSDKSALDKDIKTKTKHLENLNRIRKEKNVNLAEKTKREAEYKRAKDDLEKKQEASKRLSRKLKYLVGAGASYFGYKKFTNSSQD